MDDQVSKNMAAMNIDSVSVSGGGIGVQNNFLIPGPEKESLPSTWNVPLRNPYFTGRETSMTRIQTKFESCNQVTLTGLGGVGKTAIALEYVWTYASNFTGGVAWFDSETRDGLIFSYGLLANDLGLNFSPDTSPALKAARVKTWLEQPSAQGWLLVYNNVTCYKDIESLVPNSGGKIIFTSRLKTGWPGAVESVNVFEPIESSNFISTVLKGTDGEDGLETPENISTLGETLGYLPLALAQASFYIRESNGTLSISEYLEFYTSSRDEKREILQLLPENVPESVYITWDITMIKINELNPTAYNWFNVCACFAPDNIQYNFLEYFVSVEYKVDSVTFPMIPSSFWIRKPSLDAVRIHTLLSNYSMIGISNSRTKQFSIHRLVQEVTRLKWTLEESRTMTKSALLVLHSSFPMDDALASIQVRQGLQIHLQALCSELQVLKCPEISQIFKIGFYLLAGAFEAWRDCVGMISSLETLFFDDIMDEDSFSNNDRVSILHKLGVEYGKQGYAPVSYEYLKSALDLCSCNNISKANILSDLGFVSVNLEKLGEAEGHFNEALEISKECLGEDNITLSYILTDLSACLSHWKQVTPRHAEALSHAQNAVRILDLHNMDKGHPKYLKAVQMVTSARLAAGDKNLHDTGVSEHLKRIYGGQSSSVGLALAREGSDLLQIGHYSQAVTKLEEAVKVLRKAENLLWIIAGINLASALNSNSKHAQANQWIEELMPLVRQHFSDQTSDFETALGTRAKIKESLGELDQARLSYQELVDICRKKPGSSKNVAIGLMLLGDIYKKMKQPAKARDVLKEALEINRLDGNDVDIAINLMDLGTIDDEVDISEKYGMLTTALATLVKTHQRDNLGGLRNSMQELEQRFLGFFTACRECDFEKVEEGLKAGIDVNVCHGGFNALMSTFISTNIREKDVMVEKLLAAGARVLSQADCQTEVLAIAMASNESILLLLTKLADEINDAEKMTEYISRKEFKGNTLLGWASLRGEDVAGIFRMFIT